MRRAALALVAVVSCSARAASPASAAPDGGQPPPVHYASPPDEYYPRLSVGFSARAAPQRTDYAFRMGMAVGLVATSRAVVELELMSARYREGWRLEPNLGVGWNFGGLKDNGSFFIGPANSGGILVLSLGPSFSFAKGVASGGRLKLNYHWFFFTLEAGLELGEGSFVPSFGLQLDATYLLAITGIFLAAVIYCPIAAKFNPHACW